MQPLYCCFAMDVERIRGLSPGGGPSSWEASEQSIRTYTRILNAASYPVTYFTVPEAGEQHADLFRSLQVQGNECGLHFHVESWRENYRSPQNSHGLGWYPASEQCAMLAAARDQLANAVGATPRAFRGGYFSASNGTYQVLVDLGFTCGSTSLPGRYWLRKSARWVGKRRDVHAVNAANRLKAGTLPFVDVPLTVRLGLLGRLHPRGDTRLERARSLQDLQLAIQQSIEWQVRHESPIKHLCFFTHNTTLLGDENGVSPAKPAEVLHALVDELPSIARANALELRGVTLSQIKDEFWKRLPK